MKRLSILSLLTLALLPVLAVGAQEQPGPDSMPHEGVPKGEVLHFTFEKSRIFPGTFRDYWVYVPAQYKADKPACLYINQDGIQWNAPVVFDNLINKGDMPVTIGVFVMHGRVRAANGQEALDRFNRSLEYDGLGPDYANFLINELLPEVESKKTSDGRAIHFSHDPKDCAIGGSSSGAVCAFTAAWERPDRFSRVWSAIGTYVGIRGADSYPTLIRKYETKPLRVFLQDGSADQNIYAGDWWMENQMMERALTFAGYEVEHSWGTGGHSGQHGTAIFPDVMRYLWKGWPAPVGTHPGRNDFINAILLKSEGWQPVAETRFQQGFTGLTVDPKGRVTVHAPGTGVTVDPGGAIHTGARVGGINVHDPHEAYGPKGVRYGLSSGAHFRIDNDVLPKPIAGGAGGEGGGIVVASNGRVYLTESDTTGSCSIWLVNGRQRTAIDHRVGRATGVTLSPDQTLLYVADPSSQWVWSYQVQPDGSIAHGQKYYWLHTPDVPQRSDAGGMCVDRDGRLYVATNLGIQVCDQAGRVNCILPTPDTVATDVAIGGENNDWLYVTTGGKVYRRKIGVKGAHAWDTPNKPAAPRL